MRGVGSSCRGFCVVTISTVVGACSLMDEIDDISFCHSIF